MRRSKDLGKIILDRFGPEEKVVPVWETPAKRRLLDFLDSCAILSRPLLTVTSAIALGAILTVGLELFDDGPPIAQAHAKPILIAHAR